MEPSERIPVEPTRIGEIGVGSFLVLAGGILYLLACVGGNAFVENPARIQLRLATTSAYAGLIIYLASAERRGPWAVPNDVVSDVDDMWLIHIFLTATIAVGCGLGLLALFKLDYCGTVVAEEIETERDRRWNGPGRAKFLF